MQKYFQKMKQNNKNKRNKYYNKYKVLCCILFAAVFVAGFTPCSVKASTSALKIYNLQTKKTTTYTGKQVSVTYNGAAISNSDTPGILVDGIAMLSYYDIFQNSGIHADCVYNKAKGSITISKYGVSISMTVGSKTAKVNGKSVTLPVAPMSVKYVAANKWKVLVPSRFVAETLGLGYTWYSDKNTVAIVKSSILLSYNNGDKFEYTGALGKVTVDGANIDLGSLPSIISNNTAMLQAEKVFSDSTIGADYYYDSDNKKIYLTKENTVLVMTIDSKKALLNQKEVKLDTPPMLVSNCETKSTYVMVPGYFTATSLGYNYTWNNKTRTSQITSKAGSGSGSDNTTTGPELGDNGVINETGTILQQWTGDEESIGKYSGVHELNYSVDTSGSSGNIYYASRDYSNVRLNAETFMIVSSSPFGKVTAGNTGKKISIQAANTTCTDQLNQMYGTYSNYVNTLGLYNSADGTGTLIEFDVLPENYQYDISYSQDGLILYVTIYLNAVTAAVTGVNTVGDYLTLTGIDPLTVNITEQNGLMYLELPSTANCVGDIASDIAGEKYIKQVYTISTPDKIQFILALNEGYEYYLMESGNQYTISFQTPGNVEQPDDNQGSQDTADNLDDIVIPAIPQVTDKSKYEIVIPLSSDINTSTITNEDYYFNNYFVIRVPGDYKEFYINHSISYQSKVVDKISVTVKNNMTEIKIATTKLQGYALAVDSENLYVNIGDPRDIYKNIVVLDPGHGGAAKGAQYFGTDEKDINFKILYTIGKNYFNSDTSKLKVYYTRTADVDLSLSGRAAFVNKVGADLFVSLHMNAADAPNVNGTEVFYSNKNNAPNSAGLTSEELAAFLVTNLTQTLGTNSRGVKQEIYTVIHKNTVPAVLIELGFLSNKNEHAKLIDEEYQKKAAKTIYETLLKVFKAYPTGR